MPEGKMWQECRDLVEVELPREYPTKNHQTEIAAGGELLLFNDKVGLFVRPVNRVARIISPLTCQRWLRQMCEYGVNLNEVENLGKDWNKLNGMIWSFEELDN